MIAASHSLQALLEGIAPAPALAVGQLRLDSRQVRSGDAFVAVRGSQSHGFAHAVAAAAAGAVAVLCDAAEAGEAPALPAGCMLVPVPALRSVLGELADRAAGRPSARLEVAGITGTNGKTTCAWLLAQALEACGRPAAYAGTVGAGRPGHVSASTHTTADVFTVHAQLAAFKAAGAGAAAIEVSSHALDQGRVDGVRFRAAAITHLTRDHLDYHGTFEAYGEAKARLFQVPGLAHAVLNLDDAFVRSLLPRVARAVEVLTTSAVPPQAGAAALPHAARFLQATRVAAVPGGLAIGLDSHLGRLSFTAPLIGRFNAENLVLVLGLLLAYDLPADQACAALARCTPPPGRMQVVPGPPGAPTVVVDYAHTPDALEKVLSAARAHCTGQLWVVFGCGGDRDAGKRPQMGAIAERGADQVVVTDDNPRTEDGDAIVQMILAGCRDAARVRVRRDRREAIALAVAAAGPADLVVIAGKGHETTQTVGTRSLPFSDAEEAARALQPPSPQGACA